MTPPSVHVSRRGDLTNATCVNHVAHVRAQPAEWRAAVYFCPYDVLDDTRNANCSSELSTKHANETPTSVLGKTNAIQKAGSAHCMQGVK